MGIATAPGRPGAARSIYGSRNCVGVHIFRVFWNHGAWLREHSLPWCRRPTCTAFLPRSVDGLVKADIGPSEAETFWTAFLRKLTRRGLRGVKLVISDAHEGIKAAVAKVLQASWQRCRVNFMRNVLAHAGKSGRRVVSAFIATAFAQDDAEAASIQWRKVADQLRSKLRKLAARYQQTGTT